jgi:hypothetical protein
LRIVEVDSDNRLEVLTGGEFVAGVFGSFSEKKVTAQRVLVVADQSLEQRPGGGILKSLAQDFREPRCEFTITRARADKTAQQFDGDVRPAVRLQLGERRPKCMIPDWGYVVVVIRLANAREQRAQVDFFGQKA